MYRPTSTTSATLRTAELEAKRGRKAKNLAEFVKELIGEHVTIVSRNGIIYEGILIDKDHGFLILKDATVRGSKYTASVSLLLVKQDIIQHIHSKPQQLIENKTTQ